jgi:hypothetical protein
MHLWRSSWCHLHYQDNSKEGQSKNILFDVQSQQIQGPRWKYLQTSLYAVEASDGSSTLEVKP